MIDRGTENIYKPGAVGVTLVDPLELLRLEHTKGINELEKITIATESIHTDGFTAAAFQQIAMSVLYIGSEMRKHYEKEERYLFPLLDKHLFESPNEIRHERREMWHTFNELMMIVKDVENGRIHGTTLRELMQSSRDVVGQFKNHIERENTIIFPMVKRLLTPDEYAQFGKEIQSVTYH